MISGWLHPTNATFHECSFTGHAKMAAEICRPWSPSIQPIEFLYGMGWMRIQSEENLLEFHGKHLHLRLKAQQDFLMKHPLGDITIYCYDRNNLLWKHSLERFLKLKILNPDMAQDLSGIGR